MKKLAVVLGALLTVGASSYAAQVEVKAGVEPFRQIKADGFRGDAKTGFDLGLELFLFNAEKMPLDYGLGVEYKSRLEMTDDKFNNKSDFFDSYPVYAVAKYHVGEDLFHVVGRAGWTFNEGERADAFDKDGAYGALGLGKQFGPMTVEALYEVMDIKNNDKLFRDGLYEVASIKFGYVFGENQRDVLAREKAAAEAARLEAERLAAEKAKMEAEMKAKQEAARLEAERLAAEQARMEEIRRAVTPLLDGVTVMQGYKVNKSALTEEQMNMVKEAVAPLKYVRGGELTVESFTDSMGSKSYNQKLSQERAEKVAEAVRETLEGTGIEVKAMGMGETEFVAPNKTLAERVLNRRVVVKYMPTK